MTFCGSRRPGPASCRLFLSCQAELLLAKLLDLVRAVQNPGIGRSRYRGRGLSGNVVAGWRCRTSSRSWVRRRGRAHCGSIAAWRPKEMLLKEGVLTEVLVEVGVVRRWATRVLLALARSPRIGSGTDGNVLIEILLPLCYHDADGPPISGARPTVHICCRFHCHHLGMLQRVWLIARNSSRVFLHLFADILGLAQRLM